MQALIKSRELVKIARLEITKLEREAKEEAKIAKAHMLTASKFRKGEIFCSTLLLAWIYSREIS